MRADQLFALLLSFGAVLVFGGQAFATGALAIGGSPIHAATGIAVGATINATTDKSAESAALQNCRAEPNATSQTRTLCKVITTFRHEWLSIATDPAPDMPGFGWSIDPSRAAAESNAMNQCRVSSSVDRSQYCVIGLSKHDERP